MVVVVAAQGAAVGQEVVGIAVVEQGVVGIAVVGQGVAVVVAVEVGHSTWTRYPEVG